MNETTKKKTVEDVKAAVRQFVVDLVHPHSQDKFKVSEIYRLQVDWPKNWNSIWGEGQVGVYMHFDEQDNLLYVGKTITLGYRLGKYFQYDDDRTCKIIDESLSQTFGVRAVLLDSEPLKFYTPALEWFLIDELSPPVNIQLKHLVK